MVRVRCVAVLVVVIAAQRYGSPFAWWRSGLCWSSGDRNRARHYRAIPRHHAPVNLRRDLDCRMWWRPFNRRLTHGNTAEQEEVDGAQSRDEGHQEKDHQEGSDQEACGQEADHGKKGSLNNGS